MPTEDDGKAPTTEAKTFTQEQVDSFVAQERRRVTEKFADYEDLKAKAARLDELESANETEADKLKRQVEDLNGKLTEMESKALRAEVAIAKGLTPGQAKRLVGGTREEMEADADDILANFPTGGGTPPPPPSPRPSSDLKGGTNPADTVEETDPVKLAETVPRQ